MKHLLSALAFIVVGSAAPAHPHVFIETQVTALFDDQGRFQGVRLIWTYDDYFSLLITEDLGVDTDGDMILTQEEAAKLDGYMTDWAPDYKGDLLIATPAGPLDLGAVQDHTGVMVDGRVIETHTRLLATPQDMTGPVTVQVFDPGFYTAYTVVGSLGIEGRDDCRAVYQAADLNKAYSMADELLNGRPASDVGPDEAFPEIGQAFADTVTVTCAGS
jgi:ABC-type uncharacterized transport system substrate-binding protein